VAAVFLLGCHAKPAPMPPASPDQPLAAAMRLVCDAPARADRDRGDASRSDRIAGHLGDGVGNVEVLTAVEAWKTDGINRAELDRLVKRAGIADCKLRSEAK
jgi:hypothetical protein